MSTYATTTAARAYIADDLEGPLTDDQLQAIIDKADRDVDGLLSVQPSGRDTSTGLSVTPSLLPTWKRDALARAVCAQTEYRLTMGEQFFIRSLPANDAPNIGFDTELPAIREPYIGRKALRELDGTGLRATPSGSARTASLIDDLYPTTEEAT